MCHVVLVLPFQDVTDLFGADLPVEGAGGGVFAWRDGPLLQALKAGSWVVLDEVSVWGTMSCLCRKLISACVHSSY